jgi:ATP-binding protein involved in chromosome partitioning
MMSVTQEAVRKVLDEFRDPETGRSVAQLSQIHGLRLADGKLDVTLGLTTHSALLWKEIGTELEDLLAAKFPDLREVKVVVERHERAPMKLGQIGLTAKSVIAIGSGKGGVGKSTIAASIAYGLKRAGCIVGLMDADVYGPSIPHLIGASQRPETAAGKIRPIETDGIKVMSMGFLVPRGEAVVWRGPMLHGAITQFLRDTDWGPLDWLVIDMPPGTGDIALTLSQLLPMTGAVVVCTPQDVALLDAAKAIAMFHKVNIPVLGMVENMSYFLCPGCGQRHDIFGSGGARRRAEELNVPFLGEVPITMSIRQYGDAGQTAKNYEDEAAKPYLEAICYRLVKGLADKLRRGDQPAPLPSLPVL